MQGTNYIYILTNKYNTVLYTGVTSDIYNRVLEHRDKVYTGFTSKYNVHKLVYYEGFEDINIAIAREKQIKAGSRHKKLDLINAVNPNWEDLWAKEFGNNDDIYNKSCSIIFSMAENIFDQTKIRRNGDCFTPYIPHFLLEKVWRGSQRQFVLCLLRTENSSFSF